MVADSALNRAELELMLSSSLSGSVIMRVTELISNGLHCYQNTPFSRTDRFSCITEKLSSIKLSLWGLRRKFWLFKMCLQEME